MRYPILSQFSLLKDMSDVTRSCPILYHYSMSPFSEKMRLAMGAFDATWRSVDVPAFPPRPDISRFIGGYRRIPVVQIGAQFFCDTRLAYQALFESQIELNSLIADDEELWLWAEAEVFFAVLSAQKPVVAAHFLFRELGVKGLVRFMQDRMRMMREATVTMLSATDASALLERYVKVLSERLETLSFLSGEAPGHLDFSCYHPLWMAKRVNRSYLHQWPASVCGWMSKMEQLGHGVSEPASLPDIEMAIRNDNVDASLWTLPRGWRPEEPVKVAPLDYGLDASSGKLLSMCDERIVIRRETASGHPVYVHFPRAGFSVARI